MPLAVTRHTGAETHIRAGVRRGHLRRPRLRPLRQSPARTSVSREPDGGRTESRRRTEKTPCSTSIPDGRRKKAEERAVLAPGGRPAARCGAENRPRPESQPHGTGPYLGPLYKKIYSWLSHFLDM